MKRKSANGGAAKRAKTDNAKEHAMNAKLQFELTNKRKTFGVDYLNLKQSGESAEELQACIDIALGGMEELREQMDEHERTISNNHESLQHKLSQNAGDSDPEGAPEAIASPPAKPELVSAADL